MRRHRFAMGGLGVALALSATTSAFADTSATATNSPVEISVDLGPGVATAINQAGVVAGHTDREPWTWRNGKRTPLPGQGEPAAINARGDVVGSALVDGKLQGVLWTRHGIEVLEGFTQANDINNRGEIVGVGPDGALHHQRGKTTILPDLGLGGEAHGINQHGDIAGSVITPERYNPPEAVVWRGGELDRVASRLGSNYGDMYGSESSDIGDRGHIAGSAAHEAGFAGFRIDPDGDVAYKSGDYHAHVEAVDRHGRIAGWQEVEYCEYAFAWLPDRSVILSGYSRTISGFPPQQCHLSDSGPSAEALDINDRGMVVGTAETADYEPRAVLWQLP